jgi:periplasmic protein TonB
MFDCILSGDGIGASRPRRAISLPVAIAAHAAVAAAIVGASLWAREELPEPEVPVTLRLPGAAPRGAAKQTHGSVASRPVAPARAAAPPSATLREIPVAPESDRALETGSSGDTDRGSGDPGEPGLPGPDGGLVGVPFGPGGDGDGIPDSSGRPPRPGGDIRAPELLTRVDPVYPETARRAGLQGVVFLEAIIAASGDIEEVSVSRSAGPLFDSAAVAAVRRWKYRPATLNGRAVRVLLNVTVSFRLH